MMETVSSRDSEPHSRLPSAERNRSRGVLRRQRATGRLLLPRRVRHEAGGLSRSGNRHARSRLLCRAAGQDPLCPHHAAWARSSDRRARAASRRRRARDRVVGGRRRSCLARDHQARRRAACSSRRGSATIAGEVRISAIATYGDTIHSFVERRNYHGVFMPGFVAVRRRRRGRAARRPAATSITWWAMSAGDR